MNAGERTAKHRTAPGQRKTQQGQCWETTSYQGKSVFMVWFQLDIISHKEGFHQETPGTGQTVENPDK